MISLPPYWRGHVAIQTKEGTNLNLENLKNYLADSILQEEALSADIQNNSIYFRVGLCRPFWSWKLLVAITNGIISLSESENVIRIEYKLTFEYLIIAATMMIILMSLTSGITSSSKLIIFAILWFWLVGGNILISGIRFRGFIKRCASETEKIFYHKTSNK